MRRPLAFAACGVLGSALSRLVEPNVDMLTSLVLAAIYAFAIGVLYFYAFDRFGWDG